MPDRPRKRRPRDLNQLVKLIVDISTGEVEDKPDEPEREDARNPHAVALGKLGGRKGGRARADKLTPEQRRESARRAAAARWGKNKP